MFISTYMPLGNSVGGVFSHQATGQAFFARWRPNILCDNSETVIAINLILVGYFYEHMQLHQLLETFPLGNRFKINPFRFDIFPQAIFASEVLDHAINI